MLFRRPFLPVQNTVKIPNPTLLIFLVSGFRYVSKRHGNYVWRGFGRIVPLVARSRLCRTLRPVFSRHACRQLDWRVLNRHLRRMAGQSSMEAFADYRFSRQSDDVFQLFIGNGRSDAGATLGDGVFSGLPACFRLVPADGVGHLFGAKLEIASYLLDKKPFTLSQYPNTQSLRNMLCLLQSYAQVCRRRRCRSGLRRRCLDLLRLCRSSARSGYPARF